MLYIGIDPGGDGGVACIDNNGKAYSYFVYDDIKLYKLLYECKMCDDVYLTIEDVHAILNSSASSTFKFGFNVGKAHGIINALEIEINKVMPQKWKDEYGLIYGTDIDKEEKKLGSIKKAYEIFKNINIKFKSCYMRDENNKLMKDENGKRIYTHKDHDGVAEALLIAEYGRRKNNNILEVK